MTKNFKLYYDGQHYVGEKRFDTVQDLVADGLITFYLEAKAADYIASLSSQSNYAESPYVAYNTFKKRQLAAPRTAPRKAKKGAQQQQQSPAAARPVPDRPQAASRREGEAGGAGAGARSSRANLPVEGRLSQLIENRPDAVAHGAKHSSPGPAPTTGPSPPPAVPTQPPAQSPQVSQRQSQAGGEGVPRQPAAIASYYQNSEIIQQQEQQKKGQRPSATVSTQAGPSIEEDQPPPPPRPPPPGNQGQQPLTIPAAVGTEDEAVTDGRVTSSTNTDGPVRCHMLLCSCKWGDVMLVLLLNCPVLVGS